jgi:hypothetical protein
MPYWFYHQQMILYYCFMAKNYNGTIPGSWDGVIDFKTWRRTYILCEEEMAMDTIAKYCSLAACEIFSCVLVLLKMVLSSKYTIKKTALFLIPAY